jgi:L-glutamine-phosphate cytidylyltransferase
VKAVLLGAGRGSRLGSLTDDRPKCMVELGGRPLIDWQVSALRAAGVTEVAVVRGYLGHRIIAPGASFYNPRWAQSNMVASLYCAQPWIGSGPVIVSYTDILYGPEPVSRLLESDHAIAITIDTCWLDLWLQRFDDPLSDAETLLLAPDGRVRDIGRRPSDLTEIMGQYMGLLCFSEAGWRIVSDFIDALREDERDCLDMTTLLRRLIEDGVHVYGVPVSGNWGEVDSPCDLRLYEDMLRDGRLNISSQEPA